MIVILQRFGALTLPQYEGTFPAGAPVARLPFVELPRGGVFDADGSTRSKQGKHSIGYKATFSEATETALQTVYDLWRAAVGEKYDLIALLADGTYRRNLAALENMQADLVTENLCYFESTLTFACKRPEWWGENAHLIYFDDGHYFDSGLAFDGHAPYALSSSPTTISLTNGGNRPVTNVRITVTAGDAAITALEITTTNVELDYAGNIAATKSLVIDTGAMTVEDDGVSDYANFSLGSGHKLAEWLRLLPGSNSVVVTFTGGGTGATVHFEYYDAWA